MTKKDNDTGQSTEQLILEAAEKEFMQKGYAGARTSSIAEAAGVTHAMMHYYFRTKDKLFEKIFSEKMSFVSEIMLGTIADENLPLFDRIATTVSRHFDFIAANPDIPRFLVVEVFGNEERMAMVLKQLQANAPGMIESLQRQIDEYADRGVCRRVSAAMLILDIASLNIFSFMASPMIRSILGDVMDKENFAELRKKENIDTIIRKLRP